MYNPNNFTLASSIFDINNQKNYLKEEDKPKDKFEGIMINAAAAAAVNFAAINNTPASSSQLNMTPLFSSAPNNINYKNITNNYPLNTIATTQFYNNYQNYFSPTTSFINSAFSTTKTLTTSKSELINFCGQQTKRERTKYTDSQLNYLENIFKNDKYPDGAKREDIAKILHLTDVKYTG
uniref:Homeobox domain-containing protein n=1 Tax=Meloidogyne hapla TaxID=6305 RepID=A0A1I8BIL3_MELHA